MYPAASSKTGATQMVIRGRFRCQSLFPLSIIVQALGLQLGFTGFFSTCNRFLQLFTNPPP